MSNPFKYFKDKREIWADWPIPLSRNYVTDESFNSAMIRWVGRPHFPVSPEPDWEEGKIVYEEKDFKLSRPNADNYNQGTDCERCMKPRLCDCEIAIPLPKEPKIAIDPREYAKIAAKNEGVYTPKLKLKEQQDIPMDKDEWISVKDRLPEIEDDVDVYMCKFGDVKGAGASYIGFLTKDKKWTIADTVDGIIKDADNNSQYWVVTHWKERPQSPKEEKD